MRPKSSKDPSQLGRRRVHKNLLCIHRVVNFRYCMDPTAGSVLRTFFLPTGPREPGWRGSLGERRRPVLPRSPTCPLSSAVIHVPVPYSGRVGPNRM